MSNSVQMAVRNALAATLTASPALAGGRVRENRDIALDIGEASAIAVYLRRSDPLRATLSGGQTQYTTQIEVVCLARASGSDSADTVTDALATAALARIMADPGLGGLTSDLYLDGPIEWDQTEAATPGARVSFNLSAVHYAAENTIAA